MKTLFWIIVLFISAANVSLSQSGDSSFLKKLYFKTGMDVSYYTNLNHVRGSGFNSSSLYERGWVGNIALSVAYQYNSRVQMEVQYKYQPWYSYEDEKDSYAYDNFDVISTFYGHNIGLRANYFVNDDRETDPVYFIGALSMGLQKVVNYETYYSAKDTTCATRKYSRFLIGPEAGFGIFFDMGILSLQTEIVFSARLSPIKDTHLMETMFKMNFSPVFHF